MNDKNDDFNLETDDRVHIQDVSDELKTCFLDYSMSVIVSRALPNVCDGLKPVHRRIIYSMHTLGMHHNRAHKKCARIVGEVIGKYHPHGDSSVYNALVRLAQDFNMMLPLIDGHGNFGSVDGDSAAAMRYTESRLKKIASLLVQDLDKDTVDFVENYDGSEKEPVVLPSCFPNILVNGTTGIAVGVATSIPPHCLNEVIDACIEVIANPNVSDEEMGNIVKGPDFPFKGTTIFTKDEWLKIVKTGRGGVSIRANFHFEENKIVFTTIPYASNKVMIIEQITNAVDNKLIEGIIHIRDESNYEGIRLVIILKSDIGREIILAKILKLTELQTKIHYNMMVLDKNVPKLMNFKQLLVAYTNHLFVILRRKFQFELKKYNFRLMIVEALIAALDMIDAVISLIRKSKSVSDAKMGLIDLLEINETQAQAILDLKLQRLTALEQNELRNEGKNLHENITHHEKLLNDQQLCANEIINNLEKVKHDYGEERRAEIVNGKISFNITDLIADVSVVITKTTNGYIKRTLLSDYRLQKRGGVGIIGIQKEKDILDMILYVTNHEPIFFITNFGRVYRKFAYEIPIQSRYARGIPIARFINDISPDEKLDFLFSKDDGYKTIVIVTKQGIVKQMALSAFSPHTRSGKIICRLAENDRIVKILKCEPSQSIAITSNQGFLAHFSVDQIPIRHTSSASGVKTIRLQNNDFIIDSSIIHASSQLVILTTRGFGKIISGQKLAIRKSRRQVGVRLISSKTRKYGKIIFAREVNETDELLVSTTSNHVIRFKVADLSYREDKFAKGTKIIQLRDDKERIVSVTIVNSSIENENSKEMVKNIARIGISTV